jgi:nitrogenase-stabilizing/protective protein
VPRTDQASVAMPAEVGGCDLTGIDLAQRGRTGAHRPGGDLPARLLACRDAEDYFELLGVPFDPHLLRVNRLHILRLFGPALRQYLAAPSDAEPQAAQRLRDALEAAHAVFTSSTALDHRLFKVLADRAPRGFVPLDSIEVEESVEVAK